MSGLHDKTPKLNPSKANKHNLNTKLKVKESKSQSMDTPSTSSKRVKMTTSQDDVVDVDADMVWRLTIPMLARYVGVVDMMRLMSTSKAFLLEHYTEYPANLLYNVFEYVFCGHVSRLPYGWCFFEMPTAFELRNAGIEWFWFAGRVSKLDERYVEASWRMRDDFYKLPHRTWLLRYSKKLKELNF